MALHVVRVKWGKEKYDGIQLDTDELPITFKMQLFSLTGMLTTQSWSDLYCCSKLVCSDLYTYSNK